MWERVSQSQIRPKPNSCDSCSVKITGSRLDTESCSVRVTQVKLDVDQPKGSTYLLYADRVAASTHFRSYKSCLHQHVSLVGTFIGKCTSWHSLKRPKALNKNVNQLEEVFVCRKIVKWIVLMRMTKCVQIQSATASLSLERTQVQSTAEKD